MKSERGFTLVEALVAFAILAVVLTALYETMGTSAKGFTRASRLDEAVLVAESQLAEIGAGSSLPAQLEGEEGDYHWRIAPTADEQPEAAELAAAPIRGQRIKLFISWREAGAAKEIAVERLLLLERQPGR